MSLDTAARQPVGPMLSRARSSGPMSAIGRIGPMYHTSPSPASATPDQVERSVVRRYARVMRTQARESWLVPLLVVPLVEITLSNRLTEADLLYFGGPTSADGGYRGVASRARPVIDA